jgi:hypothetical protein
MAPRRGAEAYPNEAVAEAPLQLDSDAPAAISPSSATIAVKHLVWLVKPTIYQLIQKGTFKIAPVASCWSDQEIRAKRT